MAINPELSRRDFLRGAVFGGVVLSLDSTGSRLVASLFSDPERYRRRDEPLSNLAVKLEEEHGIKIFQTPPANWESFQLEFLGQALSDLPPYLYAPDVFPSGERRNLQFLLISESEQCGCLGQAVVNPSEIRLADNMIKRERFDIFKKVLAHELIHILDARTDFEMWAKFEDLLGGDFAKVSQKIRTRVEGIKISSETEEKRIKEETLHGFESVDPREAIAHIGSYYIEGRKRFTDILSVYFSTKEVNNFYTFIKEEIFRGREYN